MKNLTKEQKQLIIKSQCLKAVGINFVANAGISYLVLKKHAELTLWGDAGIGVDILATGFLLCFLSCLILSGGLAKQIRKGEVEPLNASQIPAKGWHQRSVLLRSTWLGILGVVLAAIPLLLIFNFGGFFPMKLMTFVGIKGVWAGILAGIATFYAVYWVMASTTMDIVATI